MGKAKKHTPEQIVNMLRQIEVGIANGKTHPIACREVGITEQTYYRWRKEYGGLKVDQAKRLKELEQENGKLKRLVAELSLDKQIFQDIARGTQPLWVQKSGPGNTQCLPNYEPNASPHFGRLLPQHYCLVFYCFDLQRPRIFARPV